MKLTKYHIEVVMPSTVHEGKNACYTFSNWEEACFFIESMKPEWCNCIKVEE